MSKLWVLVLVSLSSAAAASQDVSATVDVSESAPRIIISNHASKELNAAAITVDLGSAEARIYYDVSVNFDVDKPIAPGESRSVPLPRIAGASAVPVPKLRAYIYRDGSTGGEAAWINKLLVNRYSLLDELIHTRALLQDGLTKDKVKDELLTELKEERQARAQENPNAAVEEKLQRDRVLLVAAKNINGRLLVNGVPPTLPVATSYLISFFDEWTKDLRTSAPSLSAWGKLPDDLRSSDVVPTLSRLKLVHEPKLRLAMMQGQSCGVENTSFVVSGPDSCGSTLYELRAVVAGITYDDGRQTSFGTCTGDFTDCNWNFVPPGSVPGEVEVVPEPSSPGYANFSWVLDRWSNLDSDCPCNAPNYAGFNQVQVDSQFYTGVVVASCNP